jgi:hypothetical protein
MSSIRVRNACAARIAAVALSVAAGALLAGCVYYPPYATPVTSGPSTFDRAWQAAVGALSDQGLTIATQDRAAGIVSGSRGAVTVTATLRAQADGTTRVEFNTSDERGQEPGLTQRVINSYNARMGR